MSDAIAPALTPEEWNNHGPDDPSILGDVAEVAEDYPDKMQKVVALANAALPDDSPYKVTRDDVKSLYDVANYLGGSEEIRGIANKLAALLPPDLSLPGNT